MDSFDQPQNRFSENFVWTAIPDCAGVRRPYTFMPSVTIVAGTWVAVNTATTNDVQTYTVTGTPTGGSQTLLLTNPEDGETASVVIPYNATAASAQTLVNALQNFSGNLTVGGGGLPGTPLTFTGAGAWAGTEIPVAVVTANNLTGGSSPAGAVVHTTPGTTKNAATPYVNGGSNGAGAPIGLSMFDVTTDVNGNITNGLQAGGDNFGRTPDQSPVWVRGIFKITDTIIAGGAFGTLDSNTGSTTSGFASSEGGLVHIH